MRSPFLGLGLTRGDETQCRHGRTGAIWAARANRGIQPPSDRKTGRPEDRRAWPLILEIVGSGHSKS